MIKKLLPILFCLTLVFSLMQTAVLAGDAAGDDAGSYIDRYYDTVSQQVISETKAIPAGAVVIDADTTVLDAGTWYIADGTVTISSRITVNGTSVEPTRIILKDGASLTVNGGIQLTAGRALCVYGQSGGNGLLTSGVDGFIKDAAGIGGKNNERGGSFTIYGGTVVAQGAGSCAGIGGGMNGSGGSFTMYGGSVTAFTTVGAQGIGHGAKLLFDLEKGAFNVFCSVHIKSGDNAEKAVPTTVEAYAGSTENTLYVTLFQHVHDFSGEMIDNGDGTHSQACIGCDARSGIHAVHSYVNGFCADCRAEEPCIHTDADFDCHCDRCNKELFVMRSWDSVSGQVIETMEAIPEDAIPLTGDITSLEADRWYVAEGIITIPDTLWVGGYGMKATNLILKNGCVLTVNKSIGLSGSKLCVYGQVGDFSQIRAYGADGGAGIGFTDTETITSPGSLIVYGSNIYAQGSSGAAGIGHGATKGAGAGIILELYGGSIIAQGGDALEGKRDPEGIELAGAVDLRFSTYCPTKILVGRDFYNTFSISSDEYDVNARLYQLSALLSKPNSKFTPVYEYSTKDTDTAKLPGYEQYGTLSYSHIFDENAKCVFCGTSNPYFEIDENGTLIRYRSGYGNIQHIRIPSTVKKIGGAAFYRCNNIQSIRIPDSVTEIASFAIRDCNSLESITIPGSVTKLDKQFVYNCSNLTTVNISDGITELVPFQFSGCNSLVSITLPGTLTKIGSNAFDKCSNLNNITIPNSVTEIGDYAFNQCTSLSSIHIPESVTTFGTDPFCDCSNLTSVNLSCRITELNELFAYTKSLVSVTLPDSLKTIGKKAFISCSNLKYINIPDSVETIGNGAFSDCHSLESISIPDSVKILGDLAFDYCINLKSVDIPGSVKTIGAYAFRGCDSLESVHFNYGLIEIGKFAFHECDLLSSVVLPDSVTKIGEGCFERDHGLSSVILSGSLEIIPDSIFGDCIELRSVTIPDSVTTISEYAFANCRSLAAIFIPASVTKVDELAFNQSWLLDSVTFGGKIPDCGLFIPNLQHVYYYSCANPGMNVNKLKEIFVDFEKFTAFKSLIPLDHNYVNGCCTACGAPSPDAVFAFDSMQLVLSGELVMNFYGKVLNSSTSVNEGYVRFQIGRNGEEQIIYLKDAVRLDDGRYQFRCNINALQMADTITVSFHYGENMIGPKKTSVADYIDQVIAGTDRAETIALCQSIINYGHYAQLALQETHKFSLGTSAEDYRVTNRMNDVSIADPEELVSCKAVKTGEIPEITKITRSISLDNRTDINLYFTVTDGYVPDISVTDASGKSVAADISKTGKRYLLVIPNVAAHKLDETYTVTVDGKMTIKVSVLSYVYSVLTSDKTDAQKYAVSALYEYHKAAKAYMNAQ